MFHKKQFIALATVPFLLLSSCRLLVSQNPKDSFASKKLPRALELIANQKREFTPELTKRIVERVSSEDKDSLIRVGVIDSGLDLTHPDLIDQLEYKVENGKVVSVGRDIMSGDAFPSYMMVDPLLFSYGAEKVVKGIIHGELDSPLTFMKEIDARFAEILMKAIQNSPELKDSYFAKLKPELFTVFGFDIWLRDTISNNNLERYAKLKTEGKVVGPQMTFEEVTKRISSDFAKKLQQPWEYEKTTNLPNFQTYDTVFENFDSFFKVVESAIDQVDKEFNLKKNRKQIQEYMLYHNSATGKPDPSKASTAEKDTDAALLKTGNFIKLGYASFDPLSETIELVKQFSGNKELPILEQLELAKKNILTNLEAIKAHPKLSEKGAEEIEKAEKQTSVLFEAMDLLYKYETDPKEKAAYDSKKRRFVVRNYHPYIDGTSLSNSHHTHVASTIAKQDPNIRIYPIKVTTQTIAAPEQLLEMSASLGKEFEEWIKDPLIKELVLQIGKEYKKSNFSDARVLKEMRTFMEGKALDLIFVTEVLEGIKEAGKAKLLLTNVSLGMMFKKSHSTAAAWTSFSNDLFSEFVRYKMGQTIRDHAPGTLFLVANGNDGAWVDGVSKSAFPVGITSERLIRIASQKGLPDSPNNAVKNLIGVGSVNPNQGTLTGFSNFLLDSRIPQIFSTGEEIMAGIPARHSGWHEAQVKETFGKAIAELTSMPTATTDMIKLIGGGNFNHYDFLSKLTNRLSPSVTNALAQSLAITNPVSRVKMSGTSMATPTAVGLIAVYLGKKMKALGLKEHELYNHPEFTPAKIIEDVYKLARQKNLSGSIMLHLLIDGITKWKPDDDVKKVKTAIDELLPAKKKTASSTRATCSRFYK